jgi:flagellar biosynthesis/type III secretory pathway chaperone
MINDSIQNRSLLKNLKKEFKDFQAYKIGIINEKGDKIKEPVTEQEKAAYSPETKTILKIKKYLGAKLDLIEHTRLLENTSKLHYDKENHKKLLQFEDKFTNILAQLDKITCEALVEGVTMEQVQAMLQQ